MGLFRILNNGYWMWKQRAEAFPSGLRVRTGKNKVLNMMKRDIKDEAERLVREHGAEAYGAAREAMREARRRKNGRLETYFAKVAVEVARLSGREVGVDTATRYVS